MHKTSEYVTLGHPDRMADYISSYLLDRFIERDPATRFAVEVMVKDQVVTLGGEVTSQAVFKDAELTEFVRCAVEEIGYTDEYQKKWGKASTIRGSELEVYPLIGRQSADIGQGVSRDAWGDQGIFFGMAVDRPGNGFMPRDHFLARTLGEELFASGIGGLDIKTLVSMRNGAVTHVTVAIPLQGGDGGEERVRETVAKVTGCKDVTVNGTGRYVRHSSLADCGVTGRKLACDFYGGNCRVGGGSPWTKDATKADLTLNLHARKLALAFMRKHRIKTVHCAVSCSIGSPNIEVSYSDGAGKELAAEKVIAHPSELIRAYGLDRPIYAEMCRKGLFHAIC